MFFFLSLLLLFIYYFIYFPHKYAYYADTFAASSSTNLHITSPSIFGILVQTLSYGLTSPLYFTLHLWTSSTATRPDARTISVPRAVSDALPFVFVAAYILPTVAMCLPAPSVVSFDAKQAFLAAWQPSPVYISFLAMVADLLDRKSVV